MGTPNRNPRSRQRLAAGALLALLLVGCGPSDEEREQAQAALDRWADAVAAAESASFGVIGDPTATIGSWEPDDGIDKELALVAGKVEAAVPLPDAEPAPATVRWDDGRVETLPVLSAVEALEELRTAGVQPCPECAPLRITDARLTTGRVETTRGGAEVPLWEFAIEGSAVRITRVAVSVDATVTVRPPAWDPMDAPEGMSVESASVGADDRELVVTFTGAPKPGSEGCGADYEAEAVESARAVVVIVVEHRNSPFQTCPGIGARRTATVQLAEPLADRAVLEVKQGLPVPVTRAP